MIAEGLRTAFELLVSLDWEIYQIILLSLAISLSATLAAGVPGVLFGILVSIGRFKGKRIVKVLLFTFMGVPPVVMGLVVLLLAVGPLRPFDLVFTRTAMFFAQFLLVLPIIAGSIIITSEKTQVRTLETATTLGARRMQKVALLMRETKPFIFMSLILAFSRAIAEVGAVMLVGGNIKGETRVMTTFIAMNTSMGQFGTSIAMGIILLLLAFLVHFALSRFRSDFYG